MLAQRTLSPTEIVTPLGLNEKSSIVTALVAGGMVVVGGTVVVGATVVAGGIVVEVVVVVVEVVDDVVVVVVEVDVDVDDDVVLVEVEVVLDVDVVDPGGAVVGACEVVPGLPVAAVVVPRALVLGAICGAIEVVVSMIVVVGSAVFAKVEALAAALGLSSSASEPEHADRTRKNAAIVTSGPGNGIDRSREPLTALRTRNECFRGRGTLTTQRYEAAAVSVRHCRMLDNRFSPRRTLRQKQLLSLRS